MLALGFIPALAWMLVLSPLAWLALHFGIVRPEEEYLERTFGDAYRQYKARVPRYLVWKS